MLTQAAIDSIVKSAMSMGETGDLVSAWDSVQPLFEAQSRQKEAAAALLRVVGARLLSTDQAIEALEIIERSHSEDDAVLCAIGERLEAARDIGFLNAPPPAHAIFERIVAKLSAKAGPDPAGCNDERLLSALACASRHLSRQHDDLSERCYRRLISLNPSAARHHYNFGLFCKTRGRFDDGVAANEAARALSEETVEAYEWNLGICATGAGRGALALDVWKRMGHTIELGRFGLPDGRFPQCKVRLAERPLAERRAYIDDPGLEETIWIERLSACHGIIRSVLYDDLGVDYGDVILFDGAPVTYHRYGDEKIPVFPHLATLVRRGYQFFDFAGTQQENGQLTGLSQSLTLDSVIYSHTEKIQTLCMGCWKDYVSDHEHGDQQNFHVVRGRIAAPPEIEPIDLLSQIDSAVAQSGGCRVFSPDLCIAAGNTERAKFEARRFNQLA